jgi:signal transduction histidine kinase
MNTSPEKHITGDKKELFWWLQIVIFMVLVTFLHYTTPIEDWLYHLIFMQLYFIPILIGAFRFGIRGGLGAAIVVSIMYLPHIFLQMGETAESIFLQLLQIGIYNVIGYLTGLTAQREKEENLRYQQANEELQTALQKIRNQSERLSDIEEQLRINDRLAIIGELTASLAHEVRNPLGSIRGAAEILKEKLPPDAQNSEIFSILIQDTDRLSGVVENYLSFSRRHNKQKEKIDIREIISNSEMLINSTAQKQNVKYYSYYPEEPVLIHANPIELQQVLANLILNAVQAMPNGGILEISCRTEQSENKNEKVRLEIKDTGSGIDHDELKNIFEPFYTTKKEGTGLGLAIVRRICEESNWNISVNSEKGKGTKFILQIPIK